MTRAEALESTKIWSVQGLTDRENPLLTHRPASGPPPRISAAALTGGGSNPQAGEISLAHNGVLFLDELPEFRRGRPGGAAAAPGGQGCRSPRVAGTMRYPARFQLVCAMNPCKCGWYGHPSGKCTCSEGSIRRYLSRLSGPLLDRIDLLVEVPALNFEELSQREPAESSQSIPLPGHPGPANPAGPRGGLQCPSGGPGPPGELSAGQGGHRLMKTAYQSMALSGRSYDRILRVARTIADLDGSRDIRPATWRRPSSTAPPTI